ncbi:MAG: alpha-amylase family glycosyl hydrolase [Spirochaetota bacterium]|nr:alpha-amylase family glycosyl hydrolase [Spirochaetota bacterium]
MKKTFITTLLCTILLISCSPECETSFPVTPQEKKSLTYKSKTENKVSTSKEKEVTTHESKFSWDNASVYFAIIDRFYNSDPGREMAYGREKGVPTNKNDCGKFYGGNIAGLTEKLDYLYKLGINAIWISAPYEQIHGWCVGSNGAFKHYSYHGYYVLDYTNMDANIGTKEEFKTFVDEAHSRGIRVVMDVVMSHAGYNTIEDAKHLFPGVLKEDFKNALLSDYHDYIDYDSHEWSNWWTGKWVKARLGGDYTEDENKAINKELPQFITDSKNTVEIPPFLKAKYNLEKNSSEKPYYPYKDYRYEDYRIVELQNYQNYTVQEYLTDWLSKWVEEFGIDGFRCDSAKNVSTATWNELKAKCVKRYNKWKNRNLTDKVSKDDLKFWMTGEHFGHGVTNDSYYTDGGFDSMINFAFRPEVKTAVNYGRASSIDSTYKKYADTINTDSTNNDSAFNVLSYISSHDTYSITDDRSGLFYSTINKNIEKQKLAGTLLAMCPGAIQIFYGDEAGRIDSNASCGNDNDQKTRSQMPWLPGDKCHIANLGYTFNEEIHAHWSKVLNFRKRHIAIGAGEHKRIDFGYNSDLYGFSRTKDNDKVIVVIADSPKEVELNVLSLNAKKLRDYYSGEEVDVIDGKAKFGTKKNSNTFLIEIVERVKTIRFSDNLGWHTDIYARFFDSNNKEISNDKMSYLTKNKYNQNVYQITIPDNATHVVFNDNANYKTVKIKVMTDISRNIGYYLNEGNIKKNEQDEFYVNSYYYYF